MPSQVLQGVPMNSSEGSIQEVRSKLEAWKAELIKSAGSNLGGLILYGGMARGRYRPNASDVNLVLLLKDVSPESVVAIAPLLQSAFRSFRAEPMILSANEVRRSADAFPTKFLDIKRHHVLLFGENPFTDLVIDPEHLRIRTEQELRNIAMRLRRQLVLLHDDPVTQSSMLEKTARPFALSLQILLQIAGKPAPIDDRSSSIFAASAKAFGLDAAALQQLADHRQNALPAQQIGGLFKNILAAATRAAEVVDQLEKKGSL